MKTFGEILREKRKEKGLSQSQVAKKLGISNHQVCRWEAGVHFPNLIIATSIADVLECTLDELVGR